jgi:hypothetical protein
MSEIDALLARIGKAEGHRQSFLSLMEDIHAYAMPERDSWNAYGYGQQRNVKVYDSTAVMSVGRFANRLQQALFPPQQRWVKLDLPPELRTDDDPEGLQEDYERATEQLFGHIHASNFDAEINAYAHDLAAGTGCLLIENGRLGTRRPSAPLLRFQAVPHGRVAFDEGPFGTVEGVFYRQRMPGRLVARTYPDAESLPAGLARKVTDEPEGEVELVVATTFDAELDVWRMRVVFEPDRAVVVERRYRTSPWIITRWSKAPGEVYGRGPLVAALPDIRTLNKLMQLFIIASSFQVTPMLTAVDDGVLNPGTIRIAPGVIIPVRSNGGAAGRSLDALNMGGGFQLSEMLQDKLSTRIRGLLFDDPLPPEITAGLTATEVIERVRRFQQDTGAFGRLHQDAVAPIVMRCLDILHEAGAIDLPDVMDALKADRLRVIPTSPLAQAQDQADVQAVFQFLQGAAQLGETGAVLLRRGVNLDAAAPWLAQRMGIPATLIPAPEAVNAEAEAEAERSTVAEALRSPVLAQAGGAIARGMMQQGAEPAA